MPWLAFDLLESEECSPIFLTCKKRIDALFLYFFKIVNVRVSVCWREKIKFITRFKVGTLPAPFKVVLAGTIPNLALRWPSVVAASTFASELYHSAQRFIALWIISEGLKNHR